MGLQAAMDREQVLSGEAQWGVAELESGAYMLDGWVGRGILLVD